MGDEHGNERDKSETGEPMVITVPGGPFEQPRRLLMGRFDFRQMFSALRHSNYRLFFSAQVVSLTGTWMQLIAEGWLVYLLTKSALALGLIRFLHTVPVTILTLYAGVIADRYEKRRILIITQSASMVFAFVLAGLTFSGHVNIYHVGLMALLLGTAQAFDIPARQSFVVDMVGKKDLMNAIALNSTVFNGARVIGPAIGGVVLTVFSVATCFLVNAISFGAVILSYLCMRVPNSSAESENASVRAATSEAIKFVMGNSSIRSILILVAAVSLFATPYVVLMPIFAAEILGLEETGFGLLMAANGIGAFLGAVSLTTLGNYPNKLRLVFTGIFGFVISLFIFGRSETIWLSTFTIGCAGWFMILFFSTANTLVQSLVPDHLRGRVMGIYSFCFIGLSPFGSLLAGAVARNTSPSMTVSSGTSDRCNCCVSAASGSFRGSSQNVAKQTLAAKWLKETKP